MVWASRRSELCPGLTAKEESDMRRPISLAALLLNALIGGSCAQLGNDFPMERADEIKQGVTTKDEVRQIFGEPVSVSRREDGSENWVYMHSVGTAFGTGKGKSLGISFRPDGVVQNIRETNTRMRPGKTTSTSSSDRNTTSKPES